jgi:hypothetical protein
LFETDEAGARAFVHSLKVQSRKAPAKVGVGDPCENGWNVWPQDSKTFVPGNSGLAGLRKLWIGNAEPVEMLSCGSPKGDWLHVEIWKVADHRIIKIYTDWN